MTAVDTYATYIDGQFRESKSTYPVTNPASGTLLADAPESSATDVDDAVAAARASYRSWALRPACERASYLNLLAMAVRRNADALTKILVEEQSKVPQLASTEVAATADYFDYTAGWARRIEGEVLESDRPGETMLILRKPIGVVAGILPWNFPLFLVARKLAPALVTGNTCVLKPSEETPLNALMMARIIDSVGFPEGVVNIVSGAGDIGAQLASHTGVDMVNFTGSVATGKAIMRAAADNVTKVNLELGGKAPAIVLADADLDLAAKAITDSRTINTGQVCNCAERVYVEASVADSFTDKVARRMEDIRFGDPTTEDTLDMGSLINSTQLDKVAGKVESALASGAVALTGGKRAELPTGNHFEPTVLANCTGDMSVMTDEVFGPVLPIQTVANFTEAITLANDSMYGLTSSLYTASLDAALRGAREIDFGETYINRENFEAMQGFHAGARQSGIGGADGKHGVYEFTRTQMIYVQSSDT